MEKLSDSVANPSGGERYTSCAALRIGQAAPNFSARATTGPLSLSDYRGQWVLLFSHPADFTPVCTSEFLAFARAQDDFSARGCALVALSVDSLFSHLAWVRAIQDHFGVAVRFPVIEDPTLEIGRAFGMLGYDDADASAVRATYILDPQGIVRAISCYPTNVGRCVGELLRTVDALQRADRSAEAGEFALLPEGWRPGDKLLRQPDSDLSTILASDGSADWFYTLVKDAEHG